MGNRNRDYEQYDDEYQGRENYDSIRRGTGYSASRPFRRGEEYFGGNRVGYGEGYTGGRGRDHETYPRENESRPSSQQTRYSRSYGTEYDDPYTQGFGSEASRRHSGVGYSGRGNYPNRYSGHGAEELGYGRGYPESERGFQNYEGDDRGWWDKTSDEVSSWFGDEEAARRRRLDQRRGPHRGRGPSNYTRSDERIKDDINDRLTEHSYHDASNIDVQVLGGEATLTGTVESRYEKRLAEDLAEDVSGVKNVENRIRVRETSWATPQNTSASDTPGSSSRTARSGS